MPIGTPLHSRTSALCDSLQWREWAGCHAVSRYGHCHLPEYHALRSAAALLDVSPLQKVRVRGKDSRRFLQQFQLRDLAKLAPGRVAYTAWCDEDGFVVDDGTVSCLANEDFRITSNDPALAWLQLHARGLDVHFEDESEAVAALALQGPRSFAVLASLPGGEELGRLKSFGLRSGELAGVPVTVSRTGYTGDLGYELFTDAARAPVLWDAVMEAGQAHALSPLGLLALDVARVEAGFVLAGVDYQSARKCLTFDQKSSPLELGFAWMLSRDKVEHYPGRHLAFQRLPPPRKLVGLVARWSDVERLYDRVGLPPQLPAEAWRGFRPVYAPGGRQVGYATSGAWSPRLKSLVALATVEVPLAQEGAELKVEHTVEFRRSKVRAQVVPPRFFDPPGRRCPAAALH